MIIQRNVVKGLAINALSDSLGVEHVVRYLYNLAIGFAELV